MDIHTAQQSTECSGQLPPQYLHQDRPLVQLIKLLGRP